MHLRHPLHRHFEHPSAEAVDRPDNIFWASPNRALDVAPGMKFGSLSISDLRRFQVSCAAEACVHTAEAFATEACAAEAFATEACAAEAEASAGVFFLLGGGADSPSKSLSSDPGDAGAAEAAGRFIKRSGSAGSVAMAEAKIENSL